jgi:toxin FitB
MSALLDTNVLSELLRDQPNTAVLNWIDQQQTQSLFVSAVTQAEMLLGARLLPAGKRRQALESHLDAMFGGDFAGRVLPFDSACARHFAEVVASRKKAGRPVSQLDAQIAAVARAHRLRLITQNVKYFEACGVLVSNPWLSD